MGDKKTIKDCKVYTLNGIEMIHIAEFAEIANRSQQSTRVLIEKGNVVRKLKFFRDRSRLMIPVAELYGFPLVRSGHSPGIREVFHYVEVEGHIEKKLCTECTYGKGCELRHKADDLIVPEGDK